MFAWWDRCKRRFKMRQEPPVDREEIELTVTPMKITDDFHDAVEPLQSSVRFSANILGCDEQHEFYHNETLLSNTSRKKVICSGSEHEIKIENIKKRDEGIYYVKCSHNNTDAVSIATLNVVPMPGNNSEGCYTLNYNRNGSRLRVDKQLVSVMSYVGSHFTLQATFYTESLPVSFFWYRNNEQLTSNWLVNLHTSGLKSTLSNLSATLDDTGIYYCIMRNSVGTLSSRCNVVVRPTKPKFTIMNHVTRSLTPQEVFVVEGEDIKIMIHCKDPHTRISWHFNQRELRPDDRVLFEDYGEGYVGLRIVQATPEDDGYYFVKQSKIRQQVVTTDCYFVRVRSLEQRQEVTVPRFRPMLPVVACLGARCVFDINFDTVGTEFYVRWSVGMEKVRVGDDRFQTYSVRGMHVLIIPFVELTMGGEVLCEVCEINTEQLFDRVVFRSTSYLTIVPSAYVNAIRLNKTLIDVTNRPIQMGSTELSSIKSRRGRMVRVAYDDIISDNPEVMLIFHMIRISEDFYYTYILCNERNQTDKVRVLLNKVPRGPGTVVCFDLTWEGHLLLPDCYTVQVAAEGHKFWQRVDTPSTIISGRPFFRIQNVELRKFIVCTVRKTVILPYETRPMLNKIILDVPERPRREVPRLLRSENFSSKYADRNTFVASTIQSSIKLIRKRDNNEKFILKIGRRFTVNATLHLLSEFRMLRSLNHPNIIQHNELYFGSFGLAVTMEYLRGGSLRRLIYKSGALTEAQVRIYIRQICRALKYLQYKGIVHMDVKPDNIMLYKPNYHWVKLIDFGLAVNVNAATDLSIGGTRNYMAPELVTGGGITLKCDMYSLGVTAYELLAGRTPIFSSRTEFFKTLKDKSCFNIDQFKYTSVTALAFVKRLMSMDPILRPTATAALEDNFLREKLSNLQKPEFVRVFYPPFDSTSSDSTEPQAAALNGNSNNDNKSLLTMPPWVAHMRRDVSPQTRPNYQAPPKFQEENITKPPRTTPPKYHSLINNQDMSKSTPCTPRPVHKKSSLLDTERKASQKILSDVPNTVVSEPKLDTGESARPVAQYLQHRQIPCSIDREGFWAGSSRPRQTLIYRSDNTLNATPQYEPMPGTSRDVPRWRKH